jgi:hypothetical protein
MMEPRLGVIRATQVYGIRNICNQYTAERQHLRLETDFDTDLHLSEALVGA